MKRLWKRIAEYISKAPPWGRLLWQSSDDRHAITWRPWFAHLGVEGERLVFGSLFEGGGDVVCQMFWVLGIQIVCWSYPEGVEGDRAPRACRVCGCTDCEPCLTTSGPCHWVERDLCSACAENQGDRR